MKAKTFRTEDGKKEIRIEDGDCKALAGMELLSFVVFDILERLESLERKDNLRFADREYERIRHEVRMNAWKEGSRILRELKKNKEKTK